MSLPSHRRSYNKYWNNNAEQYKRNTPNDVEIKTIRIFTSNYCPFRCTFCSSSFFLDRAGGLDDSKRSKVIYLSVENAIDLIIKLSQAWPEVRTVIFDDDAYTPQIKYVNDVCRRIIAARESGLIPPHLTFICSSRVDHLNRPRAPEMLKLMKEAGFRMIMLGVESFSERVLRDFNKRITVLEIWEAIGRILEADIQPLYYVIPFSPTIELDELVDTIRQSIIALSMGVEVSINTYIWAIPGTPIYESSQYEVQYRDTHIEGINKTLKKPHFILPEKSKVRSLAEEFITRYSDYEKNLCEQYGITHMPRRTASLVTFYAMLDILGGYEVEKEQILDALDAISKGSFLARTNDKSNLKQKVETMKWGNGPWAS
ncbi:MAG TPA: radical SAM protein [Ktedonobacteraceae bacterium]|nr:radical SAM protein [Ktedonobacteraceae bacterium]